MKKFIALNIFFAALFLFSNTGCQISLTDEVRIVDKIEKAYGRAIQFSIFNPFLANQDR